MAVKKTTIVNGIAPLIAPEIFLPNENVMLTDQSMRQIDDSGELDKITYSCKELNDVLRPLVSSHGETETWFALTGHGKTKMINWRVVGEAYRILALKMSGAIADSMSKTMVLHVTLEEAVEQHTIASSGYSFHDYLKGDVSRETIHRQLVNNSFLPIIRVGNSSMRSTPHITLKVINNAIKRLLDEGYTLTMVAIDHLGELHYDNSDDQRKEMENAVIQLQQMARDYSFNLVQAGQCKPEYAQMSFPKCIPDEYAGMWSSKVGQKADRTIGFYRPWKQLDSFKNRKVVFENVEYTITPELAFMRVPKSRANNQYDSIIPLFFNPLTNEMRIDKNYMDRFYETKRKEELQKRMIEEQNESAREFGDCAAELARRIKI